MNLNRDYWRQPEGVSIPLDNLRFLYIPDDVEAYMTAELAWQVYDYQKTHADDGQQITKAVMVTMGGLLPGVLLHDHIAWSAKKHIPKIEFGTLGVQCYAGPGKPLDQPRVIQELTIDVQGHVVAVIEDLVDLGGTARFVRQLLLDKGARHVLLVAPFLKNTRMVEEMEVIWFSIVPKDTWIITPRERVETLLKRVPYWRDQGATGDDCAANLKAIGYPDYLIDRYLPLALKS
ncbi:MAG TPA: phosphoribosyltransferase [Phototrophicaceae bacterium]|nr:phosphoribosyltransferase [Phototrophicaceae bacterium]